MGLFSLVGSRSVTTTDGQASLQIGVTHPTYFCRGSLAGMVDLFSYSCSPSCDDRGYRDAKTKCCVRRAACFSVFHQGNFEPSDTASVGLMMRFVRSELYAIFKSNGAVFKVCIQRIPPLEFAHSSDTSHQDV